MTPFEQAQQLASEGKFATPRVSYGAKGVDYFGYALATHHFNLSCFGKWYAYNRPLI